MKTNPTRVIHAPRQERSRATMERLLNAAEELLADRPFDDVSIAEITRRAEASVGAFYARFENKEALLSAIIERYRTDYLDRAARDLSSPDWERLSLDELVHALVRYFVTSYRQYRGMFRTIFFGVRSRPEGFGEELTRSIEAVMELCIELMRIRLADDGLPTSRAKLDFTLYAVLTLCRDAVALGFDNPEGLTDEEVTTQVSTMALLFLKNAGAESAPS
jgi:AcrR family transcriptional regulator